MSKSLGDIVMNSIYESLDRQIKMQRHARKAKEHFDRRSSAWYDKLNEKSTTLPRIRYAYNDFWVNYHLKRSQ